MFCLSPLNHAVTLTIGGVAGKGGVRLSIDINHAGAA
jgi:hypothetical protein